LLLFVAAPTVAATVPLVGGTAHEEARLIGNNNNIINNGIFNGSEQRFFY